MASVYVQNKRGRDEFWNGGLVLPEAKRTNIGHDTDLMALLDRIDNIDYMEKNNNDTVLVFNEFGIQEENEEERLNVVIKSLEDEIGLNPNANSVVNSAGIDGNDNVAPDQKEEEVVDDNSNNNSSFVDGISEATTSVSDVGELASHGNLYYDDLRAEFGFFIDHASAADELGIIMNHCHSGEHSMANFYSDSLHGYVDNTEVFYGSLWEDDIWQVNDHAAFVQNGSVQEEVACSGAESNDVGNNMRPIQCLSAGEEGGISIRLIDFHNILPCLVKNYHTES